MAIDKFVDSEALDNGLTQIADAIRAKGGTSEQLLFPTGMASAVGNLPGPPSGPYIEETYDANGNLIGAVLHGHTKVRDQAFNNCSTLTSITIPTSVMSIGTFAFSLCGGLTSVTIPNSVTSIGDCAFYYCTSLESITIPEGVTSIGSQAFSSCSSLISITLPNSVTSIGSQAFSGCSSFISITLPNSVTSIGKLAFTKCSSLTTINVPWAEGVVSGAPWGATNATINYNYHPGV